MESHVIHSRYGGEVICVIPAGNADHPSHLDFLAHLDRTDQHYYQDTVTHSEDDAPHPTTHGVVHGLIGEDGQRKFQLVKIAGRGLPPGPLADKRLAKVEAELAQVRAERAGTPQKSELAALTEQVSALVAALSTKGGA